MKGLRVPKDHCDLIFASHVFEHLTEEDCYRALQNTYNYLRPGGYFRCIVPDLEAYTREYMERLTSAQAIAKRANRYLMEEARIGISKSRVYFMTRLREAFSNSRHQWMWDKRSLRAALEEVGFHEIRLRVYGDWADERFSEIEEKARHQDSICLEAQKPFATARGPSEQSTVEFNRYLLN